MKTNIIMAIAIAAAASLTANAQPQRMQPYSGKSPQEVRQVIRSEGHSMPMQNLDEKQREELKKIRTGQLKERTRTRNLLREKHAKLETLQTADKPDMKEINRVIDGIAAVQAQEMKAEAASRQKIRSLLTEEQRVQFDARSAHRGKMQADGRALRPGGEVRVERRSGPGAERFREQRPQTRQRQSDN
jgi:Spy/CpxP family protein refolding chaperone